MTAVDVQPAAIYVGTFEPGTEQWEAARRQGIGGSEVAAVIGLSPYESRFSLWHHKRGLSSAVEESPEMRWGKLLEPVIRSEFQRLHPELDVREVGTWRSIARPWQVANPDGLGDGCVWEAKYALSDAEWGREGTDEIPLHYRPQVMHYLDVFGLPVAYLSVFFGGSAGYREYVVEYNAAEAEQNRAACEEFLASIEADERPDIDDHSATYDVIREMHPGITPEQIDLTPETAARYLDAVAAHKAAEDEKRHATSLVADEMGDAREAWFEDRKVAIRTAKGDGRPFVKAHPIPKREQAAA